MLYVVTGANRGIGLELVRQLARGGHTVIATARRPSDATELAGLTGEVLALDVADPTSVAAFAGAVGDRAVDVLINNAGVYGDSDALDFDDILQTLAINAVGPLRVTRALLDNVARGAAKKIAHVSSMMGSISDNTSGGAYGYRMSKAALNMASRCLAIELRSRGISSAVLNPGWVQTDMGGSNAPTSVGESARGLLAAIDELSLATSGKFLDYRGRTDLPW